MGHPVAVHPDISASISGQSIKRQAIWDTLYAVLLRPDYTCHGNGIAVGNENLPIADCQQQMQDGNRQQIF